jgi:hypothetical protein
LLRNIDLLGQAQLALLNWTFEVDLLNMLADVDCLFYQGDKAIFDGDIDLSARVNNVVEDTNSFDDERVST